MATKRDRFVATFFVTIFIISTLMLTGAVVYSIFEDGKKQDNGATSTPTTSTTQQEKPVDSANALAGKPLANFTPVADIPTLTKTELSPGNGDVVKAEDTITVDYTGALASTGVVFESSLDSGQPATFPLSGVIKGWTQGVPGSKVGSTIRLQIPSDLAYGAQGSGKIAPNSDLVFDITIKAIVKQ